MWEILSKARTNPMHHLTGAVHAIIINYLFVGIPLLWIALWRKSCRPLIASCWLFIALFINTLVLFIPSLLNLSSFSWNWEGKILEIAWPILVVYLFKWMSPDEVGYKLPKQVFEWILCIGFALIFPFITLLASFLEIEQTSRPPVAADLLYQFFMPGLAEEPVYRGVFLAILNRYLGRQWKVFNIPVGLGWIFTSVLFIVVHLIAYVPQEQRIIFFWEWPVPLGFQIAFVTGFIITSFGWGYLREKTGSLWPCILSHNLANGFGVIAKLFTVH